MQLAFFFLIPFSRPYLTSFVTVELIKEQNKAKYLVVFKRYNTSTVISIKKIKLMENKGEKD